MAKNPFGGGFGSFKPPRVAKPKEPPAPRNTAYEGTLCEAIASGTVIALHYENDSAERTFGPDVVYYSPSGKVLVDGMQMQNPSEPGKNNTFHCFEVGKLRSARLTDTRYQPTRIDHSDERYRMGIICSL